MLPTKEECIIYVASWDGYSDLWAPFFDLFWRHWPDCPYPVYLGCNSKKFEHPRVNMLYAGQHNNWTDRTREHLEQVQAKYVLMMLDDWYLTQAVDSQHIVELVGLMKKFEGHMLRLVPDPKPDHALAGHPAIGLLKVGKLNRTNTHATIWRRDTLFSLMREGESLWQFEVNGSIRSNMYSGGIFSVWKRSLTYMGAVDAGKWTRHAASTMAALGVSRAASTRQIKTQQETWTHFIANTLASLLRSVTTLRFRQTMKLLSQGRKAYIEKR